MGRRKGGREGTGRKESGTREGTHLEQRIMIYIYIYEDTMIKLNTLYANL